MDIWVLIYCGILALDVVLYLVVPFHKRKQHAWYVRYLPGSGLYLFWRYKISA